MEQGAERTEKEINDADVGRFQLRIAHRYVGDDKGVAITIFGPAGSGRQRRQLLRFDCFEKAPHYHVAVYRDNIITPIDAPDPFAWAADKIRRDINDMLTQAAAPAMNQAERDKLQTALAAVQ